MAQLKNLREGNRFREVCAAKLGEYGEVYTEVKVGRYSVDAVFVNSANRSYKRLMLDLIFKEEMYVC